MVKRPILIILLGYIAGIIIGLYCKISMVLFIIPLIAICFILNNKLKTKNRLINKLKHYINILGIKKYLVLVIISLIISNTIVLALNHSYETKFEAIDEAEFIATVISEPKEKQYYLQYKIEVEKINENDKYKNICLYLNVNKGLNLKYGDKIRFIGTFDNPEIQRNYGGFNYKEYLKSIGIYGTVKSNSARVIGNGNVSEIRLLANKVSNYIKNTVKNNIQNEDNQNLLLGILLGYDDELQNNIKENFQDSSLSHILAVSGMHVSYIILGIGLIFSKLKFPKKVTKILTIIILTFFIFLTREVPSVKRACIMSIIGVRSYITI